MECPVTRPRPSTNELFRLALTGLVMLSLGLAASTATAEDEESDDKTGSLYVEYLAGITHNPNGTIRGENGASIGLFGKVRPAPIGYFIGGGLGGYVTDDVRVEVQVGFRLSEIDRMKVQGESSNAKGSEMSLLSVMYNAYYDFDLEDYDLPVPVTPWLGLGIGWGMPRIDGENTAGANQLSIDDTDSTMVYNVMAGVNHALSEHAELVLGYRYIRSLEFDVTGTESGNPRRFEYEYEAHEGFGGLRFNF